MQARSRFGPLVDRSGRDARRHGGCGQGVDQDAGGCSSSIGADEAARELSLMQIAAVWHACHALQTQFATRRAKMEEDPSKVPEMAQEDHAEFRGRFVRNHPDVVLSLKLQEEQFLKHNFWQTNFLSGSLVSGLPNFCIIFIRAALKLVCSAALNLVC